MVLQTRLSLLPHNAKVLSSDLAVSFNKGEYTFYNSGGPVFTFNAKDRLGKRTAGAMLTSMNMVKVETLAEVIGVHRSTIFRNKALYKSEGLEGLIKKKPGPKGAVKLKDDVLRQAQLLLDKNRSNVLTAKELDLSEGTIRKGIRKGILTRPDKTRQNNEKLKSVKARSKEDKDSVGGVGVKRHLDRFSGFQGKIKEAAPEFVPSEAVSCGGVLLALPFILHAGLLTVGKRIYGGLNNGFFGLGSILLTLVFMVLRRIKTPEQMTEVSPGEFGSLLGLDRGPEVKTIRRKLQEIRTRKLAPLFNGALTERWLEEDGDCLGYLYVDGHVRPYNGKKHSLPKMYVPNRHLCMPGTKEYWVNGLSSDPLFFITAEATEGLLKTLKEEVIPRLREILGPDRRLTLIFDREGWSPQSFRKWVQEGIDIITYRKGNYEDWSNNCFQPVEGIIDGQKVSYILGERSIEWESGFWLREVRRLRKDSWQTSVITTRQDISLLDIADRMFSRWTQENYLKYMEREFNFNHAVTYDVEPADPNRLVPNPKRKENIKIRTKINQEIERCLKQIGALTVENTTENQEQIASIQERMIRLKKEYDGIDKKVKSQAEKVPLKTVRDPAKIVQLNRDSISFMNGIKMVSYRVETAMINLVRPFFPRCQDEARKFMKAVFQLQADIIPDEQASKLIVRLYGMSNPRQNKILHRLCNLVNEEKICYPGTKLVMDFQTL
ncbi:MAG: helix-turn-helix domain-containing protein [Candidatus Marinimicrobia bacterium]|nr:helix-turn-helix domain-containing protein [Candidatus Neomarinimicrobiota bacterium]